MEFRKIVTITIYMRQQERQRCIEQSFGLYGRRKEWEDLREYIEICILSYVKQITSPGLMHEIGCSGLVYWDDSAPREMGLGGRWEGCSGWGTDVHRWLIHVNV